MLRYLRLYAHFLRFSFSKAMQFRLDFSFRFVMDLAFYAVQIAFFEVLYRHTALLAGWTKEQSLAFLAGYFCLDALHMSVFSSNMWYFPFLVNQGNLDGYLVRPVSSLFFVSFREFAANSFLNLLVAAGILAWALSRLPGGPGAANTLLFLALLVNGCLLYWIVQMCFLIPVFWTQSGQGFFEMFYTFLNCVMRPDGLFTGWARRILLSVLPFSLMASFPARVLFEGWSSARVGHIAVVTLSAFLFLRWFWERGLRVYASASS